MNNKPSVYYFITLLTALLSSSLFKNRCCCSGSSRSEAAAAAFNLNYQQQWRRRPVSGNSGSGAAAGEQQQQRLSSPYAMYDENEYKPASPETPDFVVPRRGVSPVQPSSSPQQRPNNQQFLVLGVCGGIASGKSKACQILSDHPSLGCVAHIDADRLAHEVYEPGSVALEEIADEFGGEVVGKGGVIDRKKLGSIVFADRQRMSALERIVWPHVKTRLSQRIDQLMDEILHTHGKAMTSPVAVVEAAMMVESGWDDLFDGMWVVRTPRSTAQQRLVQHRGLDPHDAKLRIDAQSTRRGIGNVEEEMACGVVSAVIENDGGLDRLTRRLEEAWVDPACWKYEGKVPTSSYRREDVAE